MHGFPFPLLKISVRRKIKFCKKLFDHGRKTVSYNIKLKCVSIYSVARFLLFIQVPEVQAYAMQNSPNWPSNHIFTHRKKMVNTDWFLDSRKLSRGERVITAQIPRGRSWEYECDFPRNCFNCKNSFIFHGMDQIDYCHCNKYTELLLLPNNT